MADRNEFMKKIEELEELAWDLELKDDPKKELEFDIDNKEEVENNVLKTDWLFDTSKEVNLEGVTAGRLEWLIFFISELHNIKTGDIDSVKKLYEEGRI